MRILVDTNILFSALVFPRSKPAQALLYIADNHEVVLCDRNIAELRDILKRKAPKFLPDAEVLLAEMSYELILAVDHAEKLIRDAKDQPILNAAIVSDVDIILTGDKDFLSLDMEHPKCMTFHSFLQVRTWKNNRLFKESGWESERIGFPIFFTSAGASFCFVPVWGASVISGGVFLVAHRVIYSFPGCPAATGGALSNLSVCSFILGIQSPSPPLWQPPPFPPGNSSR